MRTNRNVLNAMINKNDEFYTLYEDIALEIPNYKDYIKNKIIYCNCDNYKESNFVKYFKDHFKEFGLKKLIATNYNGNTQSDVTDLWNLNKEKAYHYEYDGKKEKITELHGNGSYDSPECLEILKEADYIITNPPFSLLKDFVPLLYEYDKQFIIVAPFHIVHYTKVFPYYKNKELFFNYLSPSKFKFNTPSGDLKAIGNVGWATRINQQYRLKKISEVALAEYKEDYYKKFDTIDVINVDRIKDIPKDYYEPMAVPLTILYYDNSDYEILKMGTGKSYTSSSNSYYKDNYFQSLLDNKLTYIRILIKRKK